MMRMMSSDKIFEEFFGISDGFDEVCKKEKLRLSIKFHFCLFILKM
jgi:hypothetical protein